MGRNIAARGENKVLILTALCNDFLSGSGNHLGSTLCDHCCRVNITHAQARILRRMAEEDNLDVDRVIKVLSTPKPNQKDKLHISLEDIGPYMPRGYTDAQCRQYLVELARREYERKQKSEKVKKELGL